MNNWIKSYSSSSIFRYGGYIHQFKYNSGHTYGDQTHILAEKFASIKQRHKSAIDLPLVSSEPRNFRTNLPQATTGNKLTETMVPGYTGTFNYNFFKILNFLLGYIPSRKFQLSDTYKVECDSCIENFLLEKDSKLKKDNDLMSYVNSQPKYTPIADSQDLREKLSLRTNQDLTNFQSILYFLVSFCKR